MAEFICFINMGIKTHIFVLVDFTTLLYKLVLYNVCNKHENAF